MKTKNVSSSGVQVFTHFLPTFGCDDRVADELDDRLERVHEAGRDQPVLLQIAPHRPGDDDEHERRDQPQHQHVLGHREVDARAIVGRWISGCVEAAVRDVLDDRLAGVELLGRACGRVRRRVLCVLPGRNIVVNARTRRTGAAETAPRSNTAR